MKNVIMKFKVLLAFCLLSISTLSAQHETLLNQAHVIGGFVAPITEFGLHNGLHTSTGGGAALVINSFFIGAYGLGSIDFERLYEQGEVDILDIGHGGLWLGGTFQPYRLVHLYGSARLGWGGINLDFDDHIHYRDIDKIFVATPEVGVELNITSWCRIAGTVGYRHVQGVSETSGFANDDLSGGIGSVTVRFGWFGRRR